MTDQSASIDFLRLIYPAGPWAVVSIDPETRETDARTFAPAQAAECAAGIARQNAAGNLYYHINPPRGEIKTTAEKSAIAAVHYLHVDVDPDSGEDRHAERRRILSRLTTDLPEGVPPPTHIIDSGNGYQALWKLREPIALPDAAAVEDAERTVDLNGAMTIHYAGSPSPLPILRQQILSGYAFGRWNGAGVHSTAAASDPAHLTRIGYAEATDLFSSFPTTFRGQSIDATTAIAAYTLAGDANLDGKVDLTDFALLATNFGGVDRTWVEGDSDYNGTVDLGDFTVLAANFNRSLSASSLAGEAAADVGQLSRAVPEPSTAMTLVGVLVATRRRHGRRWDYVTKHCSRSTTSSALVS